MYILSFCCFVLRKLVVNFCGILKVCGQEGLICVCMCILGDLVFANFLKTVFHFNKAHVVRLKQESSQTPELLRYTQSL